jgi:dolichyl-phosphate-mannose-protein mannosyltransferase
VYTGRPEDCETQAQALWNAIARTLADTTGFDRRSDLGHRPALMILGLATAVGAAFRFYGLGWGAPFFHFHIDEHFVFMGADLLRRDPHEAAMSSKFFMYSPLPMYLLNIVVGVYEWVARPLDLTVPRDQVTYMVLGRAISATLGTATIPLAYLVASRVAGRLAGALSAVLLASAVIHLRESHFFTVDVSLTFFAMLAFYYLIRIVERGDRVSMAGAGVALGLAMLSKYTALFLVPLIGLAYLLSPQAPRQLRPLGAWVRPAIRTAVSLAIGAATFLILDPLVVRYYDKFRSDVREWVTDPLLGAWKPLWVGQFAGVEPQTYWLTNLLWWGLGPAFEIVALGGLIWLTVRRDRVAWMAFAFPVAFWLLAGRTIAPFIRYAVPLAPVLAVAAGALCADGLRHPRWRRATAVATGVLLATTTLWAVAYMNVYRQPDSRLVASEWLIRNVPENAKILLEPHHNIPPTGSYLTSQSFYGDYVMWGPHRERRDHYQLYTLDVYRHLYNRGASDDDRRHYIESRLALADWILMDDTFLQQYQNQPEDLHGAVKQYYRDLFGGRLGFELVKSFKVYPELFGWTINDDGAELTFRLFDHPRVFVFRRQ